MIHRLLVVLVPAFAVLVAPAPAQAAACSGTSGVTVVVQFASGSPVVRCASGDPSSGYDALTAAGFQLTYAQGSGAGALCRIDGQPGNVNCGAMPPANNYWSYWHAKPGGSWSYSDTGGGGYDPAPGSVEGWVLGDGRSAPSIKPPGGATPTPKPTPKPTAKPSRVPVVPPAASPTTPGSTSTAATSGTTPTGTASGSATPTTTATASPSPTTPASTTATSTAAAGSSVSDSADASQETGDGGVSWIWGVGLVALLAVAAGVTAAVRRRS